MTAEAHSAPAQHEALPAAKPRLRGGLARRSAHLHLLLVVNDPVLLWASGATMLGLGLWQHDDAAVGFGGAAMIGGPVV